MDENNHPTKQLGAAKTIGNRAETLVAQWLASRGYEIIATNLRLGMLEVDIVARDGRVAVVVEVRSRSPQSFTSAFSSVDAKKRLRLRRAGERLWRRKFKNDASYDRLRFDVASVSFETDPPTIEYVQGAF